MRLSFSGFRWKPTILTLFAMLLLVLLAWQAGLWQNPGPLVPTNRNQANEVASVWQKSLDAALIEARESNRPLLVISIVGNLGKRC